MEGLKIANLGLRFLLELCALAALAFWGFATGEGLLAKVALGLGALLLAAVVWGLFVAPAARRRAAPPLRVVIELLVFGSATVALVAAGQPVPAMVFGAAVVANEVLLRLWHQG